MGGSDTHIDSSGTISYRNGDTEEITAAITAGCIVYSKDEGTTVFCAMATNIILRAAVYLGLTPIIRFQNFTPYNLSGNTNITYADLISTLFGWTSRLPQRQVNVFIRGKTLYCIQRGMEVSAIDISGWKHSRPSFSRKLLRTMYNNPFASYKLNKKDDPDNGDIPGYYSEEEIVTPFSGTIQFEAKGSYTSISYSKGLLRSETSQTSNNKIDAYSQTRYGYTEVFPEGTTELAIWLHKLTGDFYPAYKSTESTAVQYDDDKPKKIETRVSTEYTYSSTSSDNIYLTEEYEYVEKFEYEYRDGFWKLVDSDASVRQTFHTPVGSSWYATSLFVDGEPQGSSLSQSKPGNKVSLYTINEVQKTFTNATITPDNNGDTDGNGHSSSGKDDTYEDWRRRLSPIADTSFPVRELVLIRELTRDLYWLNRKTQETVTVDILDEIKNGVPTIGHIVDFTERVILDGAEYFLVSNQISFTPRSLIQKLQLVRWY